MRCGRAFGLVMTTLVNSPELVTRPVSVRTSVELAAALFESADVHRSTFWDDPIARLYGAQPAIAEQALDFRPRDAGQESAARRRAAVRHYVAVGPGVFAMRSGKMRGWELEDDGIERDELWKARQFVLNGLVDHGTVYGPVAGTKSRITCWSKKSRRNMLRQLASFDWSPIFDSPHPRALITLTYGSDWLAQAPNPQTSKAHLKAFREAYRRDVGVPYGSWKLEFQSRGAPHYHLLMVAPRYVRVWGERVAFPVWVARTWSRIVGADNVVKGKDGRTEFERHLLAGTDVSYAFGARCTTVASLSAYMMKHNAPGGRSKEYQHTVPAEWIDDRAPEAGCEGPTLLGSGPGRFWGVWELERCVEEVEISADQAVDVKRLIRKIWAQRGGPSRLVRVRRIDRRTGTIRYRNVHVPHGSNAHNLRWVLSSDGPALAASIARSLVEPVPWPSGQRRPLP